MHKILFFHAPWCQPCKAMAQEIKDLPGLVEIDIDTPEGAELGRKHRVMGTPTVVIERDETPVWECRGRVVSRTDIERALAEN